MVRFDPNHGTVAGDPLDPLRNAQLSLFLRRLCGQVLCWEDLGAAGWS